MPDTSAYKEGYKLSVGDDDFYQALQAAVDYRGDTTHLLRDGSQLEGFLFNATKDFIEFFPKGDNTKKRVALNEIKEIHFSGRDEAAGKSWDDWVKRRENERAKMSESHSASH